MNLSNDFIVDATTGRLKTKRPLDRELQEQHNLVVEAIDSLNSKQVDSAQVLIDVLDVNDNPPKFNSDQFEVVLEKRAMPGQIVFKTKAIDLDGGEAGKLIYKLESQTYIFGKNKVNSNAFEIADPASGEVILSKSILDVGGMFELVISVSDLNEDLAHISRATIKIWICDSSDIGKFVFEQSARDLNHANVEKYLHDLETILGKKQLSNTELNGIKILNDESIAELTQQQTVEENHANVTSASLLIAALVFLILLCVVMGLFVAIVYSHKRRFNRHKQICESMKAAAEMSGKQIPSQTSEPPTYKTLGETRTNPMLLQEIESSAATSIYNIGFSDSSLPTRQHSVDTR
ncbi:hypothetical protein M3Y97_00554600 [Aphelenchoides bicaudatus]|nr:hypothetical protein M3Y97_00554600 [Aphelenchoides bicaudatus]